MQTTTTTIKPRKSHTDHPLFDHLRELGGYDSDAQLAHALNLAPAFLCRMRNRKLPVGDGTIVKVMENFEEVSFKTIRDLIEKAKEQ